MTPARNHNTITAQPVPGIPPQGAAPWPEAVKP